MAGSIGSIFVDFQARTAGLDAGVKQASAGIRSLGGAAQQANAGFTQLDNMASRFAARMLVVNALTASVREFFNVIKNADSIQGLSTATVEALDEVQLGFDKLKLNADQVAGNIIGYFAKLGSGLGDVINREFYGAEVADRVATEMIIAAQKAYQQQPEYIAKVAQEQKKLNQLQSEYAALQKNITPGQRADADRSAGAALQRNAASGSLGPLLAVQEQVQAYQDLIQATRTHDELLQRQSEAQDRVNQSMQKFVMVGASTREQLKEVQSQADSIVRSLGKLSNDSSDAGIEKRISLLNEYAKVEDKISQLTDKLKEPWQMMQQTAVTSLQSVSDLLANILEGKKANFRQWAADVVDSILKQFLKLAVINPLLNGMFGMTGTKNELPGNGFASGLTSSIGSFFSGFLAGGGPASQGQAYVVGEQGPEVFIPGASGSVVPNSALQAMSSSSGGGNSQTFNQNFNVQAGVSHAEFAAAMPKMINAAKAAMVDAVRRGGPYASAFGQ